MQYDNLSVDQKAQIRERFPDYATPNKNHELVDYVMVDRKGNVISNTLTQSKFVGRIERRLQKCKTIKANTRHASITKAEAIEARLNPKLSTAKDVTNLSHQAGMNAMQTGALIACCVSSATNIYECIANGKDPKKAIKHTALL
ncbi:hypothetical protein BTM412_10330 [Helicobacter pylori]